GLDGRKMSKSYDNTIPLFTPRTQLQKLIGGIVTDSRAPGEPKETEGSALFQLYQAFADADETATLRRSFAEGIGWGDAKQVVFERVDREIAPLRAQYEALMADPAHIERVLLAGAEKARAISRPFIAELRHAVGLRRLEPARQPAAAKAARAARPSFKQYRERDGSFRFKFLDAQGQLLLQSQGFGTPQEAGRAIALLQEQRGEALNTLANRLEPIDNETIRITIEALETLANTSSGV
ncbi:MAG: tryptophan--tRNA ligase, partial [Variovorax sp.]